MKGQVVVVGLVIKRVDSYKMVGEVSNVLVQVVVCLVIKRVQTEPHRGEQQTIVLIFHLLLIPVPSFQE